MNATSYSAVGTAGFCRRPIAHALLAIMLITPAFAESYQFNSNFLPKKDGNEVDLRAFSKQNFVFPGQYKAKIFINNTLIKSQEIRFGTTDPKLSAQPCLSADLLNTLDLILPVGTTGAACVDLAAAIPGSSWSFDATQQLLYLHIPHTGLKRKRYGAAPRERWDYGLNGFMLDYNVYVTNQNVSLNHNSTSHQKDTRTPAGISWNAGLNLGEWRFRNRSSWTDINSNRRNLQRGDTYVERDIPMWNSQFQAGEMGSAPDSILPSFRFQGVQFFSDNDMHPDGNIGYAPVVKGVARTNAIVVIRQNGQILFNAPVAAGPFTINELPASSTGELDVTIVEADGTEINFKQPYTAAPQMVREGRWLYTASAGRLLNDTSYSNRERDTDARKKRPYLGQASVRYGLPYGMTALAGLSLAQSYQLAAAGLGKDLGQYGSITGQARHSSSRFLPGRRSGSTFELYYSKAFNTGLSVLARADRNTKGYRNLTEALNESVASKDFYGPRKQSASLTLNQSLGRWGSAGVDVQEQRYWDRTRPDRYVGLSYSSSYKDLSFNFFYRQALNPAKDHFGGKRLASLSVTFPLGPKARGHLATYTIGHSERNGTTHDASVSGPVGNNERLNYSASASASTGSNQSKSASATLYYKADYADLRAGVSQGSGYRQLNASMAGALVIHGGGVTWSRSLSNRSIILVHAPDAAGASLEGGYRFDKSGYAVVPSALAYRVNPVRFNTATLEPGIELSNTTAEAVPTRGAIALTSFKTRSGRAALITLNAAGKALPMGLIARHEDGSEAGIVGENGELYARGLKENTTLLIETANQTLECRVTLPAENQTTPKGLPFVNAQSDCTPRP